MRAEESVARVDRIQNVQCPARVRSRLAKSLEAMVHPIQQQELLFKFVLAGRDDLVEVVLFAQFLELWIVIAIEAVAAAVLVIDVRQRVELRERRTLRADVKRITGFLRLAAHIRARRCLARPKKHKNCERSDNSLTANDAYDV